MPATVGRGIAKGAWLAQEMAWWQVQAEFEEAKQRLTVKKMRH
jgi:hypothetical protein